MPYHKKGTPKPYGEPNGALRGDAPLLRHAPCSSSCRDATARGSHLPPHLTAGNSGVGARAVGPAHMRAAPLLHRAPRSSG